MLPTHLALVSNCAAVTTDALTPVSAAIQKQLTRDLGPVWSIDATIDVFPRLDAVPVDYWPIIVVDSMDHGGQHRDRSGQPFALVAADEHWSITASHEACEMLVDPSGSRVVAGPAPTKQQERVSFLVEVCDPCQSPDFAYTINGIPVSDFYTPKYFDPVVSPGERYSLGGSIRGPREVLRGGYLTWFDSISNAWFQSNRFENKAATIRLGDLQPINGSIRAAVDSKTRARFPKASKGTNERFQAASLTNRRATRDRAKRLAALLEERATRRD